MSWQARGTNTVLALPSLTHLVVSGDCGHNLSIQALTGGRLALPNLETLDGAVQVTADGAGSLAELGRVRTIGDTGPVLLRAANGGSLRLPGVPQLTSATLRTVSEGSGSVVDLPALVHFNLGTLEARNEGTILSPRLLFLDHATLIARDGGRMEARQIRRLLNSAVTIDNATLVFRDLYNWLGTTFSYPNGGRGEFPPPVDLNLGNITLSTNTLWAGDPLTISWDGTNTSKNPILAPWTDAVYLSADNRWDIDDLLLGTVQHPDGLPVGTGFSGSIEIMAPGVMPTNYYVLVRGDFFNQVNELTSESNNVTSCGPVAADVHVLTPDGVTRTNQFLAAKHARYFQVAVPAQEDLRVRITLPGGGATELYGGLAAVPSRSAFDQRYSRPLEPNQTLRVPGTAAGIYYVLAFADALANAPSEFTISAELLAFGLEKVTPNAVGAGRFTLVADGARFRTDSTAFTLQHAQTHTRFPALETVFASSARAYVTFDLTDADSGPYHLDAEDRGEAIRLPSALTVETAREGDVAVSVVNRQAMRAGRDASLQVRIENRSNVNADYVLFDATAYKSQSAVIMWADVPTHLAKFIETPHETKVDTIIRDLRPGEVLQAEVRIHPGAQPGSLNLRVSAIPLSHGVYLEWLMRGVAGLRESLSHDPGQFPAEVLQELQDLLTDDQAWQANTLAALTRQGLLGPLSPGARSPTRLTRPPATRVALMVKPGGGGSPCECGCDDLDEADPISGAVMKNCSLVGALTDVNAAEEVCEVSSALRCFFQEKINCPIQQALGDCPPTEVVGSVDPNDIVGPTGEGSERFVSVRSGLPYVVRCENAPQATAAAAEVIIRNPLDVNLDLTTFELGQIRFGSFVVEVPPGRSTYAAVLDASSHLGVRVSVEAGLDAERREAFWRLVSIDPLTGTWPEDPLLGVLPPNRPAERGIGEAAFAYKISPLTNAVTGTLIRNQASIVFDFNTAIPTPPVTNTVDAVAPTSRVMALPPESGRRFLVHWQGRDDTGGSGLRSYQVYYSTNGTSYAPWLYRTTATEAWFTGERGRTYSFFCLAEDAVGNQETPPETPEAVTTIPTTAPALSHVSDLALIPGNFVSLTNLVDGRPVGAWRFSLGEGAPDGATLNETNGVFRWAPSCSQASREYPMTVWVTDTGNLNLLDAATFTVAVSECVVPSLGRLVLRTGESGRVPVHLISSVSLTNLTMTVEAAAGRLTNLWLEPRTTAVCRADLAPTVTHPVAGRDVFDLTLATCPGQFLTGTQQVAWLHFTAAPNLPSAFVDLNLDNTVGYQQDGAPVRNFAPQSGRLVVIGEEPLLQATIEPDGSPALVVFGPPGAEYVIEVTRSLEAFPSWASWRDVALLDLFQTVVVPASDRHQFYRARQK